MSTAPKQRTALTGLVKNSQRFQWVLMTLIMKFCSTMGPRTMPRTIGATGTPLASRRKPRTPITNITPTSKRLLLMAKEPTMLNNRINGSR